MLTPLQVFSGAFVGILTAVVGLHLYGRLLAANLFVGRNQAGGEGGGLGGAGLIGKNCSFSTDFKVLPSAKDFASCLVSAPETSSQNGASRHLFTYGNSYNMQLLPLYSSLQRSGSLGKVSVYSSPGCPASVWLYSVNASHCKRIFRDYVSWVEQNARQGDAVIIATSLGFFISPQYHNGNLFIGNQSVSGARALDAYKSELTGLARRLKSQGVRLFVVSGIPLLKGDPMICSQWFSVLNDKCLQPLDQGVSGDVRRVGRELGQLQSDGVGMIDIYETARSMLLKSDGPDFQIYHDPGHLSAKGATGLQSVFELALKK